MEKMENVDKYISPAMQRGIDLESEARKLIYELIGEPVESACYESVEYPFMACSLDAVTLDGDFGIEIKVTTADRIDKIRTSGIIDEHYAYQCQKQMLVMEWESMAIIYYDSPMAYLIVPIERDEYIIASIIKGDTDFWNNHIIPKIPPKNEKKEFALCTDLTATHLAILWKELKEKKQDIESRIEEIEKDLKRISNGSNIHIANAGVKVSHSTRIGGIDYPSVVKDFSISAEELEKYRKEVINIVNIQES
jgi:predicted phage-related endonuclease